MARESAAIDMAHFLSISMVRNNRICVATAMAVMTVLVEGRFDEDDGVAWPTVTLVEGRDTIWIVDPGTVKGIATIDTALARYGLQRDEITHVLLTHSHYDHYKYVGSFDAATVVEYWGCWTGARFRPLPSDGRLGTETRVVPTPGHSMDSLSLLVDTAEGVVAICGDVFFDRRGPMHDPFAVDHAALDKSRAFLLERAACIVPGHGAPFFAEELEMDG